MFTEFHNINILGVSACIPRNKFELKNLAHKFGEMEVARITKSTGISSVRIAEKYTRTSDLCFHAAEKLLNELNINRNTIDAIVFISQTPDAIMPATSAKLQHRLKLKNELLAFDISYGCSGYIYGLLQASLLLQTENCSRVLVCAGDVISPYIRPNDNHIRMVFGDGGCATLVEKGSNKISFFIKTDGAGCHDLMTQNHEILEQDIEVYSPVRSNYIQMNGTAIMDFALQEVPEIINKLLQLSQIKKENIDTFAFHQANALMLNYLRKKLSILPKQMPIYVEDVGNTGPASIPLMLCELGNTLQKENSLQNTLLCGFGVGLSCGAAIADLSTTHFINKIEL